MATFTIRSNQRLSREMAFAARGAALKYPLHSWSGVRRKDGGVVMAMRALEVKVDQGGCRCLLWSPLIGRMEELEVASHQERLEHCTMALSRGTAEGLLAYGQDALFDPDETIVLAVARLGNQYWGRWGAVARSKEPDRFERSRVPHAEMRISA